MNSQSVWDPYTATNVQQLESVQRRAARFTMSRYRRTSSVVAMLEELNWEPLASRRRSYCSSGVISQNPLRFGSCQHATRTETQFWTNSNRKLPGISHSCIIRWLTDQKNSFFYRTVRDWNRLPDDSVHTLLPEQFGIMYLHKLYLRYSTSFGERESRPFHEEPETFISILTSTTLMHHCTWSLLLCTQHCRHVHRHWSGVFNLLKFDRIAKKKKPSSAVKFAWHNECYLDLTQRCARPFKWWRCPLSVCRQKCVHTNVAFSKIKQFTGRPMVTTDAWDEVLDELSK